MNVNLQVFVNNFYSGFSSLSNGLLESFEEQFVLRTIWGGVLEHALNVTRQSEVGHVRPWVPQLKEAGFHTGKENSHARLFATRAVFRITSDPMKGKIYAREYLVMLGLPHKVVLYLTT